MKWNLEKMFTSRMNKIKSILAPNNLPRLLVMLFVLLLLYIVYINFLKEGFECKSEEIDSKLGKDTQLVLFYADWCGHCKKIKPAWDEAAKEVNKKENKMMKVNCGEGTESDKEIMQKYSIDGYPTIILFKDGEANPYTGKRDKQDFISVFS